MNHPAAAAPASRLTPETKVRITWRNGQGWELESVTAEYDGYQSISHALLRLISHHIVAPGDSFTVTEVE